MEPVFVGIFTTVVVVGAAVYLAFRLPTLRLRTPVWAASRGLHLDDENGPLVASYRRESLVLRTIGVAAGFALPVAVAAALGTYNPPAAAAWPFVGYCAGAFYGAAVLVPSDTGHARALLTERRLDDYLNGRLLHLQRLLPVLVLVVGAIALAVPYREARDHRDAVTVGWMVGSVVVAIGAELLQRRVVGRRQPYAPSSVIAADDAIRSHLVQTVSGAAMAVVILGVSTLLGQLAMSDVQVLRWTMWVPATFGWMLAVYACLLAVDWPWRVRRSYAQP